ncbi:MAG: precorrin isomerase [Candidatus Syntrophonatronum acetioxidans]|uniref:Precorrin isomerase n=1 Tax=Candidatus Syntrophonatronum acetioxidans TaxID=1795816 RepID=A0A424YB49_9FIRM|nr:MAG: precorrin isomerase [Candidatus Syntrophonatronum acetioxidans]
MRIIDQHLQDYNFTPQEVQVVKRVIHATGDPSYAQIMVFSPGAVEKALLYLSQGKNLITDVEMVRVGISKKNLSVLGGESSCFIHHPSVMELAREGKITRASQAVKWARQKIEGNIMVVGNAPTALFTLLDLVKENSINPAFIVGVPVGFVGSKEAKEELEKQDRVPFITCRGVKGGSPVAVAVVNALLKLALEKRGEG